MERRSLSIIVQVARLRVWHEQLAARLEDAGHRVLFEASGRQAPVSPAVLLALEGRIYGARSALFVPAPQLPLPLSHDADCDLVIALDSRGSRPRASRTAAPLIARFDGVPGEDAMVGAILAGAAPQISVTRETGRGGAPNLLALGLPAMEDPAVLARALDHVLVRLIMLLVQAVERIAAADGIPPAVPISGTTGAPGSAPAFFLRGLVGKVRRRLATIGGDHWQTSWRFIEGPGVAARFEWPSQSYTTPSYATLTDDGQAYYADPFPFEKDGRHYIFCEEFPYATEKGRIVVFEVGVAGRLSGPTIVLEREAHLSYPQVFARDGAIFMLPEMGAAGRIELFRALDFPHSWVSHGVLVDNVVAADATFIEHCGRCWLFATLAGDGGSSWDQLALFHAPTMAGPWRAHPGNPVLIDAGAARPAGAMWMKEGALFRVAQDCRSGYGAGLAICRVDRLDPDGYEQTVVRRLGPPNGFGANGVHTLNRSACVETIDWRAPRRRS